MQTGWNAIELGGVEQWVSLRGRPDAPLLLYLHGGPGGCEYGPRRKYLAELERNWLVVDWDQRGGGRSFRGDESAETLSLDRLVSDGLELVERLCQEHARERLVLVGHSFGTVLGVLMASRAPHRVAAYVGAGQVVNWSLQEERSYEWALSEARRKGNRKAVAALEKLGRPGQAIYAAGTQGTEIQRRYLGELGGVSADPSFLLKWVMSILLAPDYPLKAKLRLTKGMRRSMGILWPELGRRVDFKRDVTRLECPVYLFAGRTDRITDLAQVEEWLAALQAPEKRLEVVEDAGHLNLFEAPHRFVALMDAVRARVA